MPARFATRLFLALVLGTMASVTPAVAQGRYDSEYDHFQRDRHEAQHHRWEDRRKSLGHAIGDLFRDGTTNPYSSPEHYYRDQQRRFEHGLRDQDRVWDHVRRDRWNSRRNDGYPRNDLDYRSGDNYRYDQYRSRDDHDRSR